MYTYVWVKDIHFHFGPLLSHCLNGLKLLLILQLPKIPGKAGTGSVAGHKLAGEAGGGVPGGFPPVSYVVLWVWRLEQPGM